MSVVSLILSDMEFQLHQLPGISDQSEKTRSHNCHSPSELLRPYANQISLQVLGVMCSLQSLYLISNLLITIVSIATANKRLYLILSHNFT